MRESCSLINGSKVGRGRELIFWISVHVFTECEARNRNATADSLPTVLQMQWGLRPKPAVVWYILWKYTMKVFFFSSSATEQCYCKIIPHFSTLLSQCSCMTQITSSSCVVCCFACFHPDMATVEIHPSRWWSSLFLRPNLPLSGVLLWSKPHCQAVTAGSLSRQAKCGFGKKTKSC